MKYSGLYITGSGTHNRPSYEGNNKQALLQSLKTCALGNISQGEYVRIKMFRKNNGNDPIFSGQYYRKKNKLICTYQRIENFFN